MAVTCDILIVGGGVIGTSIAYAPGPAPRRPGRPAGEVLPRRRLQRQVGRHHPPALLQPPDRQHGPEEPARLRALRRRRRRPARLHAHRHGARRQRARPGRPGSQRRHAARAGHRRPPGLRRRSWPTSTPTPAWPRTSWPPSRPRPATSRRCRSSPPIAEAARREGADIRLGVEVKAIVTEGDKVVGVETNEGRYDCRHAWSWPPVRGRPSWRRTSGVKLPVQACRTQVALFRRPPDFGRRGAVYGDFVQGIYFKPTHGDMIHAGSLAGEEVNDPVDPDHYNEAADGDWLPQVRQRLSRRYPAMHRGYGRGGYGALYAITPDWHPILDRLPGPGGGVLRGRLQRPRLQDVADRRPADGRADRRRQGEHARHRAPAAGPLRRERPGQDAVLVWRHGLTPFTAGVRSSRVRSGASRRRARVCRGPHVVEKIPLVKDVARRRFKAVEVQSQLCGVVRRGRDRERRHPGRTVTGPLEDILLQVAPGGGDVGGEEPASVGQPAQVADGEATDPLQGATQQTCPRQRFAPLRQPVREHLPAGLLRGAFAEFGEERSLLRGRRVLVGEQLQAQQPEFERPVAGFRGRGGAAQPGEPDAVDPTVVPTFPPVARVNEQQVTRPRAGRTRPVTTPPEAPSLRAAGRRPRPRGAIAKTDRRRPRKCSRSLLRCKETPPRGVRSGGQGRPRPPCAGFPRVRPL